MARNLIEITEDAVISTSPHLNRAKKPLNANSG